MSFSRSLPVFVSIFVSAGLWLLGILLMPAERGSGVSSGTYARRGFAVLVCSEAVPDREIRERLEKQGFTGLVSESGQWVLLDSFGSIEQIPLDEYHSRVLPFDPRNDGYAEKLRSLFVRDNRRFIYIPLVFAVPAKIEKRLASALGDIPYSFEYTGRFNAGSGLPAGFSVALFFLAAAAFFIIRPLRLALRPHAAGLVPCLPILSPLALGGAVGCALAGLLAACAALLAGLVEQSAPPHRRGIFRILGWLLPPVLLIGYGFLAFSSGLSPVFTLLVPVLVCGVVIFSLRGAGALGDLLFKRRNSGHRRFSPVPILRRRTSGFAFAWAILPFAAAALVLAAAGIVSDLRSEPVLSPSVVTPLPSAPVTEADYLTHYLFQSTFSQRALHASGAPEASGSMRVYQLAPDGLVNFSLQTDEKQLMSGVPPFPLNDLLRYLETKNKPAAHP